MRFEGRHGYYDYELEQPQPFEVDVELVVNLQPAGVDDDLTKTIDYGRVYAIVRQIVEAGFRPVQRGSLYETIRIPDAAAILADKPQIDFGALEAVG